MIARRAARVGPLVGWLAGLLVLAACGGGGGGGGGGIGGPTTPGPSITFSPAGTAGPNALALRQGPGSTASRLILELVAEDVAALYGISFDLQFPVSVLSFEAASEGAFFASDGSSTTLQAVEQPAGNLVIGLSRLGQVPGLSGTGVLLTLEFRPVGSGSGTLRFEANQAFDASGDPLPAVVWGAGSVQVVL